VIVLPPERVGPYVRALSAALSALAPGEDHVPLSAALDHLAALDPVYGGLLLEPAEVWQRTGMPAYTWLERARSEAELAHRTTGASEPSEAELVRVHALDAALAARMRDRRALHRLLRTAELLPATRLVGAVRWFGRIDTSRSVPRMEATVGLAYDRLAPDGRWVRVRVELVATGSVEGPLWVDRAGRLHLDERLRHLLTRHFADAPDALRHQLEQVTEARVTRISRSFLGPFWFPGVDLPDGLPTSLASGLLLHASTEVSDPQLRESRNFDPFDRIEPGTGDWPVFRERRFAAAGQAAEAVRAWAELAGIRANVVPIAAGRRPRSFVPDRGRP
jgi:hypothetical protein